MRISKFSVLILTVGVLALCSRVDAQNRDLRRDYRDVQGDYARLDALRADVARDRYQLDQARRSGDRYAAHQIKRDLNRDEHAMHALEHDIRHDRHDIRQDQRDLYRDRY